MGDRRSYGNGRGSVTNRRVNSTRPADQSQRNLFIGVGFFVVALVVIGLILFAGGDDDDDNQGIALPDSTSTSTTESAIVEPSATATDGLTPTNTAEMTVTATSTTEAVPATATTEEEEDPTATSEEDVEPTPTDEPVDEEPEPTDEPEEPDDPATDVPEPTEEPVVGEFGNLPPAQIVSGGLTRPLNLEYELATSLDNAPSSAPVYLLEWPEWTEEDVATIAANLDMEGEVEGGPGNYQVFGTTSEIYFSGSTVQYVYTGTVPDITLGSNEAIIETARSWIYANGIISDDLNGGSVIGRDDAAGRVVVLFQPVNPSPLLAFVPSATVTVGQGGIVLEANIRWPSNYIGSDYGLRSGDELWNRVLAGEGSIEADLSGVSGSGPLSGTMTVYDISIAYSYAGSNGGEEYLVPLVVFSGEATLDETGEVVPVSIYVTAVYGQATPQG